MPKRRSSPAQNPMLDSEALESEEKKVKKQVFDYAEDSDASSTEGDKVKPPTLQDTCLLYTSDAADD